MVMLSGALTPSLPPRSVTMYRTHIEPEALGPNGRRGCSLCWPAVACKCDAARHRERIFSPVGRCDRWSCKVQGGLNRADLSPTMVCSQWAIGNHN